MRSTSLPLVAGRCVIKPRSAGYLHVIRKEKSLKYELSEAIKLVLKDGDVIWPTTMDGTFRLITKGEGHNVLGEGEHPVGEKEMIDGVLNKGMPSRWRSKTNAARKTPNHFSITSPSVTEVHINVRGVWVRLR